VATVSVEEAQLSKERLLAWAKSDNPSHRGNLDKWIYDRSVSIQSIGNVKVELEFINSLTPNAVQKAVNWKTPSEFPCCPQKNTQNSIAEYAANLNVGKVFSRNQYTSNIIECFEISENKNTLWVMCKNSEENPVKPYSLAEITYQNDVFVHNSLGTFSKKGGAEKQFTLVQGLEWTGENTIDDYC